LRLFLFTNAGLQYALLIVIAISSFGVYGIVFAGWSSTTKYAFLGGIRSAAQMISYESTMGMILLIVMLFAGSANMHNLGNVQ